MYFLNYRLRPAPEHPDYAVIGETWANCWIVKPTLAAADRAARKALREDAWEIVEREEARVVDGRTYKRGDPWREHFEAARDNGSEFVLHLSPRFPVFAVLFVASQPSTDRRAQALFLVSGESLFRAGEELVAVPNFWDAERRARAVAGARTRVRDAGWQVDSIAETWPCGPEDIDAELTRYYDEAEELGSCLVFLHTPDGAGANG